MVPLSYASSPGSLGSYDSFNGGSYGSYGDNNSMHMYYSSVGPSGMNIQARGGLIVGTSPDARQRASQLLPGNGYGVSPSTGSFGPMSLGASPSQFTPSSPLHAPAGSPGNYGPSSPLRGSVQGLSLLGKVATTGHRRSLGYHETFCNQPQGNTSSHHRQWHHTDGTNSEGSPRNMQSISSLPSWKQQRGGNGISSQSSSALRHAPSLISQVGFLPSSEPYDKPECSSSPPDPGHWDPNYRWANGQDISWSRLFIWFDDYQFWFSAMKDGPYMGPSLALTANSWGRDVMGMSEVSPPSYHLRTVRWAMENTNGNVLKF